MTDATTHTDTTPSETDSITMYGADWCGDCIRAKALLDARNIDYTYIDLVAQPDGADAAQKISGRTNIPVILFPDGSHQVEPSNADLESKLSELSLV